MNKFRNCKKVIALSIIIFVIFASLVPNYHKMDFALANDETKEQAEVPISEEDFLVLEIVPNIKFAEFGYLVGGQEPIDVNRAYLDGAFTTDSFGTMSVPLYKQEKVYRMSWEEGCVSKIPTMHLFESGYYEKLYDTTGDFDLEIIQMDESGGIQEGRFVQNIGAGQYKWVEAKNTNQTLTDYQDEKVWMSNQSILVYEKNILIHSESFKKISLNDMNRNVIVKSVTPNKLTKEDIDRADLLYISPKIHLGSIVESLWNNYGKNKSDVSDSRITTFAHNDLSWEEAFHIFKRVAIDKDRLPIIMDASLVNGAWDTNVEKLYFMLHKMNPQVFYNLYLNDNTNGEDATEEDKVETLINDKGEYKLVVNSKTNWVATWDENWFTMDDDLLELYGILGNKYSCTQYPANVSVIQNIYTYNGDNALPRVFTDLESGSSVWKNLYGMDNPYTKEFFTDITANGEEMNAAKNSTSPAIAVKYIIGYQPGKNVNDKRTITILNIEPCNDFTKNIIDFKKMMPHFTGTIRITKQTSLEFNGKIEDLNKMYDMIYLGLNCGNSMFTLGSDKLPKYNDADLDGKIYLHVGDRIIGNTGNNINYYPVDWLKNSQIAGFEPSECRLPGNDITGLKKKDIQEYIKAGYPVVVDPYIYKIETYESKKRVDQTSNIYQLIRNPIVNKNRDEVKNLMNEATLNKTDDTMLEKYLAIIKPTITMLEKPTEYVGKAADVLANSNHLYINGYDSKYHKLNFKFEISDYSDIEDQNYTVEFYVDRNADGKFNTQDATNITGDSNDVTSSSNSTSTLFNAKSEKLLSKENCKKGINDITISLSPEFVGAIPWKLVIYNADHPAIRTEETGISAFRTAKASKETINVLQIDSNGTGDDKSTINLATHDKFIKYTEKLNDFNIVFTRKTITEYEDLFTLNKFDKGDKGNTDQLTNKYDMLIFGFSDMYPNISNENGALDNLEYFIDSGRSVLFTHDVTSFNNKYYEVNQVKSSTQFGYNFNKMFRGFLSMDRFGARIGNGDLLMPNGSVARDIPTKPNGGIYQAIHGYTTYALKRIGSKAGNYYNNTQRNYKNELTKINVVPVYPNMDFNDNNLLTKKVSKLNSGQITDYPYLIDDEFICGATHAQYFQLDLEDDNVVVWYCLANDSTTDGSYYGKSPNDASNNYYIYNKGNITYSGVGHSTISNDMEVQLFVNTIIAAYKAGYKQPTIQILNEDAVKSENNYYLYIDNEGNTENFANNSLIDIEFVANEVNLLSEHLSCKAILSDDKITDIYNTEDAVVTATIKNKESESTTLIKSGDTYKLKYDLSKLNGISSDTIRIVVENEMGLQNRVTVTLLKRGLFDLD